jgi:hypothetical protein
VALAETYSLQEARPAIGHYWSTKDEWNASIRAFLLESHLKKRTIQDELAALSTFSFQKLPIKKKLRNTQLRLDKLVFRLFPPKHVAFIKAASGQHK